MKLGRRAGTRSLEFGDVGFYSVGKEEPHRGRRETRPTCVLTHLPKPKRKKTRKMGTLVLYEIRPYICIHIVCTEGIYPCNMERETFTKENTRDIIHRIMTSQSLRVGTLEPHAVLPVTISCPVIFFWISSMVWNLSPFKGDFSFGTSQKSQGAKSGL